MKSLSLGFVGDRPVNCWWRSRPAQAIFETIFNVPMYRATGQVVTCCQKTDGLNKKSIFAVKLPLFCHAFAVSKHI